MDKDSETISYCGPNFLRQRLVLSTLSGRSVRILDIRPYEDNIGLRDYEIRLFKLLDEITNGSRIDINETGTELFYQPGLLQGGKFTFDCGLEKSTSYFLEVLIYLSLFVKNPVDCALRGITNDRHEVSPDTIKAAWLPVMARFLPGGETAAEISIKRRGLRPNGGGELRFSCPLAKHLRPVHSVAQGKVKKIRGSAFVCKVSPLMANRMINAVKSTVGDALSDVYVYVDQRKGASGGLSPGFGINLTAETTEGVVFSADSMSKAAGEEPLVAEDVGTMAVAGLFEDIWRGGCVSSSAQALGVLFMALGGQDVCEMVTGPLSDYTVEMLRAIKRFFGVTFSIDSMNEEEDRGSGRRTGGEKVKLVCVGAGYSNINKVLL